MPINVKRIEFGELDARNEVFQQKRADLRIFQNAFLVPPSVDIDRLIDGARYFISGQKGSGKTALIWYLHQLLEDHGGTSSVILFKSNLTEVERQRISQLNYATIFNNQNKIAIQYDYKQNWIWYIIKSFCAIIDESHVIQGKDVFRDLKTLTGATPGVSQSVFSGLQFTKIKAAIDAGLKAGPPFNIPKSRS